MIFKKFIKIRLQPLPVVRKQLYIWLGMSRTSFLLPAMEAGAVLLEDSGDDLARETSLIKNVLSQGFALT